MSDFDNSMILIVLLDEMRINKRNNKLLSVRQIRHRFFVHVCLTLFNVSNLLQLVFFVL